MNSDPNGGGVDADVADRLARLLGSDHTVLALTDHAGTVVRMTVMAPGGLFGVVQITKAGGHRPGSGQVEWWVPHYDPNGAPWAWASYDPTASDGTTEAAEMITRARPGRC